MNAAEFSGSQWHIFTTENIGCHPEASNSVFCLLPPRPQATTGSFLSSRAPQRVACLSFNFRRFMKWKAGDLPCLQVRLAEVDLAWWAWECCNDVHLCIASNSDSNFRTLFLLGWWMAIAWRAERWRTSFTLGIQSHYLQNRCLDSSMDQPMRKLPSSLWKRGATWIVNAPLIPKRQTMLWAVGRTPIML